MGKKAKAMKASTADASGNTTSGKPAPSTSSNVAGPAKSTKSASVATSTHAKQPATTSEIDDIFAGKKKSLDVAPTAESSSGATDPSASRASRKKKRKLQDVQDDTRTSATTSNGAGLAPNSISASGIDMKGKGKSTLQDGTASAKEAPTVTVVEASSIPGLATGKKRAKTGRTEETVTPSNTGAATSAAAKEEDDLFRDSRGTSRRTTDDGLPIYDIKELNIGLGGDTELCPFDCDCCF